MAEKMTSEEMLLELRNYNPDGTPVNRYWLTKEDKWWDIGFYFHIVILIGVWVLYDALTTGYMTPAQFKLDHIITVVWVWAAAVYSFVTVIIDVVDAAKGN